MYKTGDLARYRADGMLEFLGRLDDQVKLRGVRIELGEIEAVLGQHPSLREIAVVLREDVPGHKRLVAYVVPIQGSGVETARRAVSTPDPRRLVPDLRAFLAARLPDYMVPAAFVALDRLPRMPTGKIDRKGLPAPDGSRPDLDAEFVAPRTTVETLLAAIWAQVLGLEQVSVDDNFFALGGDSILSLQIIARARQAGLLLNPRDVFENQTIAALAAVAEPSRALAAEQGTSAGPVPLTPIQHLFFAQDLPDLRHFNQALLLETGQPIEFALLARAVRHLLAHHDALRLRFFRGRAGWVQINAVAEDNRVVGRIDLTQLAPEDHPRVIEAAAAALQTSLDLEHGPLMRVAHFDLGVERPGRLLLIVHHLAVDGVSWRVLLEDLQAVYGQLRQQAPVELPPKTTAFQAWAEHLAAYAQTPELRDELSFWLDRPWSRAAALPLDERGAANTGATTRTLRVTLDAGDTDALLHEVPPVYHTQINDILLAAIAQGFAQWTGSPALLLDLEAHGREALFADVDLSRTVGWYTMIFPILLELPDDEDLGETIKAIKEQLRRVPQRGIGYGVLRYLSPDATVRDALATLPSAEVSFNYLGQVDQVLPAHGLFGPAGESPGPLHNPHGQRNHLLEINGVIANGQLQLAWTYSTAVHRHDTIERLAKQVLTALRALIAYCQSPDAGGFTPSDFPLLDLSQDKLDATFGRIWLEDAYPLSPTQQGILFHALYAPDSGMYLEQLTCMLCGDLDLAAFVRAWQSAIDRHPILRSAFVWKNLEKPLQAVSRRATLPLDQRDWRGLPPAEQETRLAAFVDQERRRDFDLTTPPLLRLTLIQLGDQEYRFVWSCHHMLFDGWSIALVLQELFASYVAFAQGRELRLPRARPYRDYIAWLQRQDQAAAETFWRETLRGFTTPTPLVVDRSTEAVDASPGPAEQEVSLGEASSAVLQALARQHGLTLNTLILGAWALLLHRYSGQNDVLFGMTLSGRPPELPGVEQMVGLFIASLPVRVRIDPGATALGWLRQVQAAQLALGQFEYSPLVQIQRWSEVPPGLPLFESLVVFENYPVDNLGMDGSGRAGLKVRDIQIVEHDHYPLTLVAAPGAALALRVNYNAARFTSDTIARLLGHMRTLLEGMTERPAWPLAELSLLAAAERAQLLVEWNATAAAYPRESSLTMLFAEQVQRTPEAIAIVFDFRDKQTSRQGDKETTGRITNDGSAFSLHLTYTELNARANQLAHHLRELGIGPNTLVGICVERSLETLVAVVGTLKAGGAFLPLDPAYPQVRLEFMLHDSRAAVLLAGAGTLPIALGLAQAHPEQVRALVCLDATPRPEQLGAAIRFSNAAMLSFSADVPPTPPARPEDLAYMMYTSGSTGQPKGVPIRHSSAVPFFVWYQRYFGLRPDDRILQYHSLSFDFSTWEIFEALLVGAALYVVPTAVARDVGALADVLVDARITMLNMTPSQFESLAEYVEQSHPAALAGLRILVLGGEMLSSALARRTLRSVGPACQVYNEYGPTETTISSSIFQVSPLALAQYGRLRSMPIGQPIGNTHFYVLDAQLQPVPVGVSGELYIGGVGLAGEYFNRPALTAERFVPNPFAEVSGAGCRVSEDKLPDTRYPTPATRLYKTGDLARWLPEGVLEFLGRVDQQVKLRGYRIELGEIAAALAQHEAVREAVVVVREDAPGEQRLVAYIVPIEDERQKTKDEIMSVETHYIASVRQIAVECLPTYMVPSAFVVLDALPLTPNGKLDRKALPAPDGHASLARAGYIPPRTPIEEVLASIWAGVLHVARVGTSDNFFELGGHSLLATQVISRIRETFQVELPLRTLFDAPTLARLAEAIAGARDAGTRQLTPPLRPTPREGPLPLSFAQQRLWFLAQLDPDSPAYHMPTALRLHGVLDLLALRRSLVAILVRHEALRTAFALVHSQPAQQIAPAEAMYALPLPLLDLSALPPQRRDTLARELAYAHAHRPFDLARAPLLRLALLRLAAHDHVLLATMHHIISDGWSQGLLVHELVALYAAGGQAAAALLPALPIQYADYTLWQREWLQGKLLEAQLAYWTSQLAGTPTLDLPTDHPRPPIASFQGAQQELLLDAALLQQVEALSRREGVTLFMTLVAAVQTLLGRLSAQHDFCLGTPLANRTHPATEHLIGFFVNTLVLRADLSGNPPFRTLLERVRALCLDAYAHQDVPFELLVETLAPSRDLSRAPLFEVMLALDNAPRHTLDLPGLSWQPLDTPVTTTHFDLGLSFRASEDALVGVIEYRSELFEPTTIVRLAHQFQTLLVGALAAPDTPLAALELLGPSERQQLLLFSQAPALPLPSGYAHERVAAQAARSPDAVALVCGQQHLSYAELNRRATQLAYYLQALGVGPDLPVAIELPRSLELVIALLGVLSAGGAFVPLDPSAPSQRRAFILADARIQVLITTKDDGRWTTDDLEASQIPIVNRKSKIVNLQADWPAIAQQPIHALHTPLAPQNLAYLLYTSGTSGQPKAVLVEHASLTALLATLEQHFAFAPDQTMPALAAANFDIALFELLGPLQAGGTALLVEYHELLDRARLLEALSRCTALHAVPSLLSQVVQALNERGEELRHIRQVYVGGDAVPPALPAALPGVFPRAQISVLYGPTEATVICARYELGLGELVRRAVLGRALAGVRLLLLDAQQRLVPLGVAGELYIGGAGLARGYLGRPDLTAERFVPNPFVEVSGAGYQVSGAEPSDTRYPTPGTRLYRTGDLARYSSEGVLEFVGRLDGQVKVRGFRVELGEVEARLGQHPLVRECAVLAREDTPGEKQLVAYIVEGSGVRSQGSESEDQETRRQGDKETDGRGTIYRAIPDPRSLIPVLRDYLKQVLPSYMIPSAFVVLDALPLSPNGKLDRNALPAPNALLQPLPAPLPASPPRSALEHSIAEIWRSVLGRDNLDVNASFFDLGGHSLHLMQVHAQLQAQLDRPLALLDLFRFPSIAALARFLSPDPAPLAPAPEPAPQPVPSLAPGPLADPAIAIIGFAGRFPQASDTAAFWQLLAEGREAISFFSPNDLRAAGFDPAQLADPAFVPATGVLDDIDAFDAAFFGYSPREAELLDPQQRLFLECAFHALEHAGYAPTTFAGRIAVFAGASPNSYLLSHLLPQPALIERLGGLQTLLLNAADHLATRLSYKLNLRGPSLTVQTACSTSLVATVLAVESLLLGKADLALAGGVSINVAQRAGYLYHDGGIHSPDGHCRAFDAQAQGCVPGNGLGIVVLKRLQDAIAQGDTIYAVIKGVGLNNDGADKIGYTAPSIEGQAAAIAEALAMAQVAPETIGFVEAHGTGTLLGDPIELAALRRVFGERSEGPRCALGSVKTNIGHLDAASGVSGLLKAVLALHHRQLPPSLHFQSPNPRLELERSRFYVPTRLETWEAGATLRRAGVSSFGIGGTNAHVVLEEAPALEPSGPSRPWQLLVLSAHSAEALERQRQLLAEHLRAEPEQELADVAYTLQVGRTRLPHRQALLVDKRAEAIAALEQAEASRSWRRAQAREERSLVFVLPGQGAQELGMGRELYRAEPLFCEWLDRCAELLAPHLRIDVREIMFGESGTGTIGESGTGTIYRARTDASRTDTIYRVPTNGDLLDQTQYSQPALFALEYALAQLWLSWGIAPQALLGHSLGEYVAATLAGVFSLEDALALVAERGRLMQQCGAGAMLSVALSEAELLPCLGSELDLAAVNGPKLCVVAGTHAAVEQLEQHLRAEGVECRRLRSSHAFHSALLEPIQTSFAATVARVPRSVPRLPLLSNVSGSWLTAEEATDPSYWARQMRAPVRYAEGLRTLASQGEWVLLEVGPGRQLSTLARQTVEPSWTVLASLGSKQEQGSEQAGLLATLGQLWLAGVDVEWARLAGQERRRRVALPLYPFARTRYWIERPAGAQAASWAGQAPAIKQREEASEIAPSGAGEGRHERPGQLSDYVAPRTAIEEQVAEVWRELLGIDLIGVQDGFYELGGHSLLATQLVRRLREAFPVELTLGELFEAENVAAQAELIEAKLVDKLAELSEDEVRLLL